MTNILANIKKLHQGVNSILVANSRAPDSVLIVAVSKTHSASYVETAYKAGQTHFGENYIQEAAAKISQLQHLPITWHFIGHLQSNKARLAAEIFDWVQSVSSLKLAKKLNQYRSTTSPLNICVQVNISREESKFGLIPENVKNFCLQLQDMDNLSLRGLMAISENTADIIKQKENFCQMHDLFEDIRQHLAVPNRDSWDSLSMGMSADMKSAIECNSTMLRIGRDIFGCRN